MALKQFLYYLLEEDGRSNRVVNGVVTTTGTPTPLPNTPDGWQEVSLAWERNREKHGILRGFSRDLGFVKDGAHILRDAYYKNHIDRKMFLLIQQLGLEYDPTYYKWLYSFLYKGEIDLSTFKDTRDKVTVNIMEGGLSKSVNIGQTVVHEIPLTDDPDTVFLKMDGIELQERAKYEMLTELSIAKSVYGTNFFAPATFINREGELPYIFFGPQSLQEATSLAWDDKLASDNYMTKAADNNSSVINVLIEGTIRYSCTDNDPSNGFRMRFIRSNQLIADQNDYEIFADGAIVSGSNYEHAISLTIPLLPGERLYLEGIYTGGAGNEVSIEYDDESVFHLSYQRRGETSYVPAMTRKSLMRKLLNKIAGHEDYSISTLLDSDNRLVTSGDALRGIEDAVIKTSLQDFFGDVNADLCAGMGIEAGAATANLPAGERLTIEARAGYYDSSSPIDLGEVQDWEVAYAADMAISAIKVGWKEPDIENVNGKYEFNAQTVFTTPQKRINREYNIVSPYKGSAFEAELTRISMNGKDSTDAKNDNDCFVIVAQRSQDDTTASVSFLSGTNVMLAPDTIEFVAGQKIRITGSVSNDGEYFVTLVAHLFATNKNAVVLAGTLVTEGPVSVTIEYLQGITYQPVRATYDNQGDPDDFGVPSPTTVFNLDLSPKRMILRHGPWIRSLLHGYDAEKLVFASGTRNTNLKTEQGATVIDEDTDINISSLGDKLFIPNYLNIKADGNVGLGGLMDADPNRCFECEIEGVTFTGFNIKAGMAPNELGVQEYMLLSTIDNDFEELIN